MILYGVRSKNYRRTQKNIEDEVKIYSDRLRADSLCESSSMQFVYIFILYKIASQMPREASRRSRS